MTTGVMKGIRILEVAEQSSGRTAGEGMSQVKISEEVAAPAAQVWELLGDFGGLARWCGPVLQSCTVEGSGVGAVRTIGLPGGNSIRERLEGLDPSRRTLSYSIVGKSPIPVRDYLATCRVVETGPSECRVDWEGRFEPDGVSEAQARSMLGSSYSGSIGRVRKLLGA